MLSRTIREAWAHEQSERPSTYVLISSLKNDPFERDDISPLIPPLEDGLRAYRERECFEIHAEPGYPNCQVLERLLLKIKGNRSNAQLFVMLEANSDRVPCLNKAVINGNHWLWRFILEWKTWH
ncbi:21413_t:CDS:2 [Dentiscutata erythropus]|uniref:21413_t:CDS:1 n=1 Tax=Dentiscutata erythropus TaxID=1348616 RepID=A0A9N9CP12_9GLOM|nr:21413_t:CDS:2 [Dentiscutata erythropus]